MTGIALSTLATPLQKFAQSLGSASPVWADFEELTSVSFYDEAFNRQALADLELDDLLPLAHAYGEALTFECLSLRRPVLRVTKDLDQAAIDEFRQITATSDSLVFRFELDKTALLAEKLSGLPPFSHPFLFLAPLAADRYIQEKTLSELESDLWGEDAGAKVLLLVPASVIRLDGEYLAVLGGDHANQWQSVLPGQHPDPAWTEEVFRTCQETLKWQAPWLKFLTPFHLRTHGVSAPEDALVGALRVHLTNLTILYTADRTAARGNQWVATYAGAEQSAEVHLASAQEISLTANWDSNLDALVRQCEWAYDPDASAEDRLAFIQIAIAQTLHASEDSARFFTLLREADHIRQMIRWHWKTYIEGKIDEFITQVQALESYLSDTVRAYADQVSDLIKSLSETMLAAVAVLLGSFIASLFQQNFNPTVFRLGLWVYAGYVAVFPLLYNMLNQYGRFRTLEADFCARRERYEVRLTRERVANIIGEQVAESRRRFWAAFAATILTYLAVIVLALWAANYLPEMIIGVAERTTGIPIPIVGPYPQPPYP